MMAELPEGLSSFAVAEAVADRLCSRLGTQVPSPATHLAEWWRLDLPPGATDLHWASRKKPRRRASCRSGSIPSRWCAAPLRTAVSTRDRRA